MTAPTTLDHAIATAVHAGVRTVLVHDAAPELFASIAARLAAEVGARFGTARTVRLGGREDDGALFGDWAPRGEGVLDLVWRPGALEPPPDGELIVTLTDLSHADRDLRRALLATTAGGPVHVERNGQQRVWIPRLWWLVGCPYDRVGAVTPHLIDRFAVRLRAESHSLPSVDALRRFLQDDQLLRAPPLPPPLPIPTASLPEINDAAFDRALSLVSSGASAVPGAPDLRRALALLRLAAADVTLRLPRASREAASRGADLEVDPQPHDIAPIVDAAAVERCAAAFDLALRAPAPLLPPTPDPSTPPAADPTTRDESRTREPSRRPRSDPGTRLRTPVAPSSAPPRPAPTNETTTAIGDAAGDANDSRYAEDAAPVLRDPETLRMSFGARMGQQRGRGRVLGSEPADTLSDLSLVDTMLAAARRRCFEARRLAAPAAEPTAAPAATPRTELPPLRIKATDLRRRRRAPAPGDLLVVVLDHTSLDWSWGNALSRYLREAYVRRSSVALIQVGAAGPSAAPAVPITADELRARSLQIRNVRSKALYDALTPRPGRATPLAHGLALAADAIRAAATRGRSHASRVRLVVVSDGRGNVRLSDSQAGTLTLPTRTEGVRDALDVAAQIRTLRGVEAVVLHRRDDVHADLPLQLARALGGKAQSLRTGGRG